jgi:polysaccharide export outer membrane protein
MAPEVDGQSQTIRQDGKVTLRLIGEVKVAGMTPVEIGRKLESLLKKYYMDPQVSVAVSGSGSKHIYVFGQVAAVGALPYTGRDTLLDVLSKARPTIGAWKSRVKVIHPSHEEGKRRVITVNVDRIMKEGKLDQNILLQEGDILYIPPTPLTWIALRVRELLYPFEPSVGNVGILSAGGTTMGVTSRQLGGY